MKAFRALDANINRSAEGLRVLEDMARFRFDNAGISADLRGIRHRIRDLFRQDQPLLLSSRRADRDVGKITSSASQSDVRGDDKDMALSNFKRVQEAFRSIEEHAKTSGSYETGKRVETLRFNVYSLEKKYMALFQKLFPKGVYGILGEKFSQGRTNVEVAQRMVDAGIDILQYREKVKDKACWKCSKSANRYERLRLMPRCPLSSMIMWPLP